MADSSPVAVAPSAGLLPSGVRVLLIDDQAIVGESVRRMLVGEPDIEFLFCQDPSRALATANEFRPTVILQDLVMPEIDGLQLVRFFRANPATRQTPMVVLSSREEPATKAQAFALGANDYLVKLPDTLELIARIRYHSRSYLNLLERNEAYRQLEESQKRLADELAQAARYVRSLLPEPMTGSVAIDWKYIPSTQLAGDMFGYHWLDAGHLALYLLDVSGHGVGSSLLAVSASNVLASRSLPDTDFRDPGQVLSRLNDVFQMERQAGKFFTIFYAVYRLGARELAYSNGGHPAALLFTGEDAASAQMHQLAATDPVIGMMPPDMPFETQVVPLGPFARLLIYSDGVFEVEQPSGVMWTFPEFVAFVERLPRPQPALSAIQAEVRRLRGQEMLADDFSLLEVQLDSSLPSTQGS
jgi:sigma-B regulation protein RsbU (phosphoserine phosphatase)